MGEYLHSWLMKENIMKRDGEVRLVKRSQTGKASIVAEVARCTDWKKLCCLR